MLSAPILLGACLSACASQRDPLACEVYGRTDLVSAGLHDFGAIPIGDSDSAAILFWCGFSETFSDHGPLPDLNAVTWERDTRDPSAFELSSVVCDSGGTCGRYVEFQPNVPGLLHTRVNFLDVLDGAFTWVGEGVRPGERPAPFSRPCTTATVTYAPSALVSVTASCPYDAIVEHPLLESIEVDDPELEVAIRPQPYVVRLPAPLGPYPITANIDPRAGSHTPGIHHAIIRVTTNDSTGTYEIPVELMIGG